MESSVAPRVAPLLAGLERYSRLLPWPQEQFILAEYDDLALCHLASECSASSDTIAEISDDAPLEYLRARGRAGWQVGEPSNSAESAYNANEPSSRLISGVSPSNDDWVLRLSTPGRAFEEAVAQLHDLLLRAAGRQVSRMREANVLGAVRREEIIHSAADEATVSVLSRLSSFEGRSAFTTWAYKFGILQAGTEVRRAAWRDREINLDDVAEQSQTVAPSPESYAEGRDLAQAVRDGLREALTPHQRRVAVAVLIDEVPIDVLAERLSINRGALYKTLHDARQRLRAYLSAHDFLLPEVTRKEVTK